MKTKNWIIIDRRTSKAIYGYNKKAMEFSSKEVVKEVASQLFKENTDYVIFNNYE
jgi:hypothetical protein